MDCVRIGWSCGGGMNWWEEDFDWGVEDGGKEDEVSRREVWLEGMSAKSKEARWWEEVKLPEGNATMAWASSTRFGVGQKAWYNIDEAGTRLGWTIGGESEVWGKELCGMESECWLS